MELIWENGLLHWLFLFAVQLCVCHSHLMDKQCSVDHATMQSKYGLLGVESVSKHLLDTHRKPFNHYSVVSYSLTILFCSYVLCAVFLWDGKCVLSCSDDKTVREWNVHTGECTRSFRREHSQ